MINKCIVGTQSTTDVCLGNNSLVTWIY